jgi:8-hydroxy-5-deazaflavin:NADPH oxidoreductase
MRSALASVEALQLRLSSDATAPVAALAKQLGFAPVKLGKLNEGGALVHARGRTWGQLIFQDLLKKEQ